MNNQSAKRITLTIALVSGLASQVFQYVSLGHYPKTSEEQVWATVGIWLGIVFIVCTLLYGALSIVGKRR